MSLTSCYIKILAYFILSTFHLALLPLTFYEFELKIIIHNASGFSNVPLQIKKRKVCVKRKMSSVRCCP